MLADVQREVGEARFIVRTAAVDSMPITAGEGRKIRLDPRRPIDLLGGGQVVLPPSRGSKAKYEIIRGTLDDLTALTPIRAITPAPAIGPSAEQKESPFSHMQANYRWGVPVVNPIGLTTEAESRNPSVP